MCQRQSHSGVCVDEMRRYASVAQDVEIPVTISFWCAETPPNKKGRKNTIEQKLIQTTKQKHKQTHEEMKTSHASQVDVQSRNLCLSVCLTGPCGCILVTAISTPNDILCDAWVRRISSNVFANSLESPTFLLLWLKGIARDLRGTQAGFHRKNMAPALLVTPGKLHFGQHESYQNHC